MEQQSINDTNQNRHLCCGNVRSEGHHPLCVTNGQSVNDIQIGGSHYDKTGEQHWDRAWRLGWDFYQYQITKYVERWKAKNGIEDLKKAQHFLNKYIEVVESEQMPKEAPTPSVLDSINDAEQRRREQYNLNSLQPFNQKIPDRF